MPTNYLAFAGLALVLVIAPGPDFAVVMKNSLMYGRVPGVFTSLGVVGGLLVQGLAAALGVAALVVRSAVAFNVLKIVGAVYLGYLGVQALRAAFARRRSDPPAVAPDAEAPAGERAAAAERSLADERSPVRERSAASARAAAAEPSPQRRVRAFRQGFLSNITNPKVLAFYFSLLPQFVGNDRPALPQVLLLAATHALFSLIWLLIVVSVLSHLREFLRRPRVRRVIEGFTGAALVGFGVRLITSQQ